MAFIMAINYSSITVISIFVKAMYKIFLNISLSGIVYLGMLVFNPNWTFNFNRCMKKELYCNYITYTIASYYIISYITRESDEHIVCFSKAYNMLVPGPSS